MTDISQKDQRLAARYDGAADGWHHQKSRALDSLMPIAI